MPSAGCWGPQCLRRCVIEWTPSRPGERDGAHLFPPNTLPPPPLSPPPAACPTFPLGLLLPRPQVMRPRINVEALEVNATLGEFLHLVNKTQYSRIPVYEEEIDHIVGVTIVKVGRSAADW